MGLGMGALDREGAGEESVSIPERERGSVPLGRSCMLPASFQKPVTVWSFSESQVLIRAFCATEFVLLA